MIRSHTFAGTVIFPNNWLWTPGCRQKIHHFFFSHTWGTRFKYLPKLCPYIFMYSALHIMQWFSHILDVFTPKIRRNFFDFYILQMLLTQDFNWSLGQSIALQRQIDLLLCTITCFLQWDRLQNVAVGDLAFYLLYIYGGIAPKLNHVLCAISFISKHFWKRISWSWSNLSQKLHQKFTRHSSSWIVD